ncbi:MAG: hypothetical protein AB8E82_11415 [Aureispira sp.]
METKLKKLESLKKLDYSAYEKLLKTSWPDLMADSTAVLGYALVDGQHLPWKGVKPEAKPNQPMLYVGPITKWKMELNGSAIDLKGYSYGACKVVPVGQDVHVYLAPQKGKLTDEKLLKPLKKTLKKFKPKVFLEVVADLSLVEVEPQTQGTLSDDAPIAKVVQKLAQEIQQYHLATNKIKKLIATAKPEEKAKLQVKYQSILRKLKHICVDWKEQVVPQTEAASNEQAFANGQKIFQHWQGFFDKRKEAKLGTGGGTEGAKAEGNRLYTKVLSDLEQLFVGIEQSTQLDSSVIESELQNLNTHLENWKKFIANKESQYTEELKAVEAQMQQLNQDFDLFKPHLQEYDKVSLALKQAKEAGNEEEIQRLTTAVEESVKQLSNL